MTYNCSCEDEKLLCLAPQRVCPLLPLERFHGKIPDLRAGDLVMVRAKNGGIFKYMLRKINNTYWDHVAMVVFPKDLDKGHKHNIIVESSKYSLFQNLKSGVALHLLDKYLTDPHNYDVGICRLTELSTVTQKRARALALMSVDTPGYPIPVMPVILSFFNDNYKKIYLSRQRYPSSSFVQKILYEAEPKENRSKVLFKNGYTLFQSLDTVSPHDIAESEIVEWIWNKHL